MIKIDVVSGFLGAGKTTFIKKIINAASKNGERIVIIENEFGEAGIDGKMLQHDSLEIYEISKGCLCCSLKNDFITTLSEIIKNISPDRIIIEPSGIFVLSEIYDIMKIPEIASCCYLNSVITIIDSIHFTRFRKKYNFFFENQIKYSSKLVLSKTESVNAEIINIILSELHKINSEKEIIYLNWSNLSDIDIISILNNSANTSKNYERISNNRNKLNLMVQKNHGFNAFNIKPENKIDQNMLRNKLSKLKEAIFGKIIRAKGFIESEEGLLQFNYIDGEYNVKKIDDNKISPSINIIGEKLNKESLRELFS